MVKFVQNFDKVGPTRLMKYLKQGRLGGGGVDGGDQTPFPSFSNRHPKPPPPTPPPPPQGFDPLSNLRMSPLLLF